MKNSFLSLSKLVAVAACALTLGSCSRAEYAMLPKGSSYHGVARAATPVPPATAEAVAVEAPAAAAPLATVAPASVAKPAAAPAVAKAPTAAPAKAAAATAATSGPVAAPKLNLVQRVALTKISKKIEKATQKSTFNRHENTAATQKASGKLRQALILGLVGLLVEIIGAVTGSAIIYLVGALLILVAVVFLILYLLDEL